MNFNDYSYYFICRDAQQRVKCGNFLLQDAADFDRPAAEAEDRERDARKKFTADEIKAGFRYKAWNELRTVVGIGKKRIAIDDSHFQVALADSAEAFAEFLNSSPENFTRVAP